MAGIAASKAMLAAFARSNTKYADIVYVDWNRALAMTAESPASEAYVHACIKLAAASTEIESDSAARWFLTETTKRGMVLTASEEASLRMAMGLTAAVIANIGFAGTRCDIAYSDGEPFSVERLMAAFDSIPNTEGTTPPFSINIAAGQRM